MNFNNLPCDIKRKIYNINKNRDKHDKLLKKCKLELLDIEILTDSYNDYVRECIGYSIWDHENDYKDWVIYERVYDKKYYMKKKNIVKYIIQNYSNN